MRHRDTDCVGIGLHSFAPGGQTVNSAFDPRTGTWEIGWPRRVGKHDVVYPSPPEDPMQRMPVGNGYVGRSSRFRSQSACAWVRGEAGPSGCVHASACQEAGRRTPGTGQAVRRPSRLPPQAEVCGAQGLLGPSCGPASCTRRSSGRGRRVRLGVWLGGFRPRGRRGAA